MRRTITPLALLLASLSFATLGCASKGSDATPGRRPKASRPRAPPLRRRRPRRRRRRRAGRGDRRADGRCVGRAGGDGGGDRRAGGDGRAEGDGRCICRRGRGTSVDRRCAGGREEVRVRREGPEALPDAGLDEEHDGLRDLERRRLRRSRRRCSTWRASRRPAWAAGRGSRRPASPRRRPATSTARRRACKRVPRPLQGAVQEDDARSSLVSRPQAARRTRSGSRRSPLRPRGSPQRSSCNRTIFRGLTAPCALRAASWSAASGERRQPRARSAIAARSAGRGTNILDGRGDAIER